MKHPDTSWNNVAKWYDRLVGEAGSDYHQNVIFPAALRLLSPKKGEKILDVACGQGAWCRELSNLGCVVTGIDAAQELIALAEKRGPNKSTERSPRFMTMDASNLSGFADQSFDAVTCILALQNFDPIQPAIKEMARVLRPGGKVFLALNHPCFRIPRQSGWGFDEKRNLSYRRIDSYLSEQKIPIEMHPSQQTKKHTWTFHRPLQTYFQILGTNGLAVSGMEELVSHRQNQPGKNQKAENRSRQEIPLFLALLAVKGS